MKKENKMQDRKKLISKIIKIITAYTKPVGYSVECFGCRKGLANLIVDTVFFKKTKQKKEKK